MKILWTKSNLPLSVLIQKVTHEPVSHVGILLNGKVIHSNMRGLSITKEADFRKSLDVVYEIEMPFDSEAEDKLLKLIDRDKGNFYDIGALVFLGICFTLRAVFKIPLPKHNLWQATGMFLCTEWVSKALNDKEDSMITPYGLYLKLLANKSATIK